MIMDRMRVPEITTKTLIRQVATTTFFWLEEMVSYPKIRHSL